jgi:GTPase SAR1 family protein
MTEKTGSRSLGMAEFASVKDGLLAVIDEMLALEGVRGCPCEELAEKLREGAFDLVVAGQFKRGKTSLINALIGADILPVSVVPLTSIITVLTYGPALRVKVHFNGERTMEIKPESLPEYVTEKGNPKNEKNVKEVVVEYPSPYLKDGVRIVDTPGVGSVYEHNTDAAYRYLPRSDAVLFLLSVDQPLSRAEFDFLGDVGEYANKIFFLLNKADYLSDTELGESVGFLRGELRKALTSEPVIFPVSAKLALEGKVKGSDEALKRSRLPEFSEALREFLMNEKGRVLLRSVADNLLRILSQGRFEAELELGSLSAPLQELEEKLRVFGEKKTAIMREKRDIEVLLEGKTKELVSEVLEEDLRHLRGGLTRRLGEGLISRFEEGGGLSTKGLHASLETYIRDEVAGAYDAFRASEDAKLAGAFEEEVKRLSPRVDGIVDRLLQFASELFAIPYEAVRAEGLWADRSALFYKFRDEPVGLEMLVSGVTFALPGSVGKKLILRSMKGFIQEAVDRQSGRVRHDFVRRLQRSGRDFGWEIEKRVDVAVEGIEAAVKKGMDLKVKSEEEVAERRQVLLELTQKINGLSERVTRISRQGATAL